MAQKKLWSYTVKLYDFDGGLLTTYSNICSSNKMQACLDAREMYEKEYGKIVVAYDAQCNE